eukprot:CAMPEP_0183378502 /NCGR_PEP_ID=MMETSP0164_2-20130417/124946_1 /TAXON_ID=221442 /ORGANISM="Coccolithus pelagicus ssp braarudi, Strain PLY182g" /LENGTH=135 /DNA_ID=CAMNT_0025556061 /DNA_START=283 /DNA_END=691 /DNA_ORIENTATION=-
MTVSSGRIRGVGKLRREAVSMRPRPAGTLPSGLALSAVVPGDFPQSWVSAEATPSVCSEACLGGVPPAGSPEMAEKLDESHDGPIISQDAQHLLCSPEMAERLMKATMAQSYRNRCATPAASLLESPVVVVADFE